MINVIGQCVEASEEQGARQLLYGALGPDGKEGEHTRFMKGGLVMAQQIREPSDFVIGKEGREAQNQIWVS